jgi:hypothetical protein
MEGEISRTQCHAIDGDLQRAGNAGTTSRQYFRLAFPVGNFHGLGIWRWERTMTGLLNKGKNVTHRAFENFLLDSVVTCGQVADD